MNKVIYTAIFGPYEELKEPKVITPGWQYICFTDQDFKSDVWQIFRPHKTGDVRLARNYKIQRYYEYDRNIWIDGSFIINCNLDDFWDKYFISPFTVFNHPIRDCVYEECQVCIMNKRAPEIDIAQQMDFLHQERVRLHGGLIQSGILMRENTPEVEAFCSLWWEQIKRSTRDQIGFAYCEHRMPGVAQHSPHPFDYRRNEYFTYKPHYHKNSLPAQ